MQDSRVVENLSWKAPEVFDNQPCSTKSDVFAFGIIMWELLTLLPPWTALPQASASPTTANNDMRSPSQMMVSAPSLLVKKLSMFAAGQELISYDMTCLCKVLINC